MASAEVRVSLKGGVREGGMQRFQPGETVEGSVEVVADGNVKCNHLYVRLQWHTEGRGTQDTGKVSEMDVFQGSLSGGMPSAFPFYFVLPLEPWSYAGYYVSIVWEIHVELDVPWSRNPRHSHPFAMSPRPAQRPRETYDSP
jgi:hypothetical protein